MSVLVLWSLGVRCLQAHTDGEDRVAVLVDAGRVVGLWRLPPRHASLPARSPRRPYPQAEDAAGRVRGRGEQRVETEEIRAAQGENLARRACYDPR